MVLPFFDLIATSPEVFFSATVPPGAPEPQFQDTEGCQYRIMAGRGAPRTFVAYFRFL